MTVCGAMGAPALPRSMTAAVLLTGSISATKPKAEVTTALPARLSTPQISPSSGPSYTTGVTVSADGR
ncbi:hypothetical protein NEH83_35075 [Streptomyces sp. JUS-F4]|uniref:hypothetical protein n=1 Tax=Streptomyces sp. JUS-F4 TaxID=2951988 RepID=UPI002666471D|nr:hypothetical protein [Streptomyces sp. JUS-F4]WKN18953.1 hypothetical protein NEH83_35075 [Streptomyces sp. JUS-F4]